jgi:dihydrofolate reductase
MRDVIVSDWMTLDGVVQAPAYPDEDTSDGFAHGGWNRGYLDEGVMRWVAENVASAGAYLLGRRTYQSFAAHWPSAGEEEQVLARRSTRDRSTSRRARSPSHSNGRTHRCSGMTSSRRYARSSKRTAAIFS